MSTTIKINRAFEKIKIVHLGELDTGWVTSLKDMALFVEYYYKGNGVLSSPEKQMWAQALYGCATRESLMRLTSFAEVAGSIRDEGYITLLNHAYEFDGENYIIVQGIRTYIAGALPRVICGTPKLIDDGRHKLAVLSALQVEKTPVIIMKVPSSSDPSASLCLFNLNVIKGIETFKHSEEWRAYMTTDDYKKLNPAARIKKAR